MVPRLIRKPKLSRCRSRRIGDDSYARSDYCRVEWWARTRCCAHSRPPRVAEARTLRASGVLPSKASFTGSRSIVVDTDARFLYYMLPEEKAVRYGVIVGEDAQAWSGVAKIGRKQELPSWTPTEGE